MSDYMMERDRTSGESEYKAFEMRRGKCDRVVIYAIIISIIANLSQTNVLFLFGKY